MKRLILTMALITCLTCGSFWNESSIWKNWDHAYFSLWGYKNATMQDAEQSKAEGWWGCPVEVE